jgi:hypothetical protein
MQSAHARTHPLDIRNTCATFFEKTVRRVGPINFELRLREGARSRDAEVRCISMFLLFLTNPY